MTKRRNSWSYEEIELLKIWISEHQEVKIGTSKVPQDLLDLLSTKAPTIIYHKWYKLKKSHITTNTPGTAIGKLVEVEVNKVMAQLQTENAQLIAENTQLKALLQKLKGVREAIEKFQL